MASWIIRTKLLCRRKQKLDLRFFYFSEADNPADAEP